MKRKLSLLMVLMMVLTLIPAMPSFATSGDISVTKQDNSLVLNDYTGVVKDVNGNITSFDPAKAPGLSFDNSALSADPATRPVTTSTVFTVTITEGNAIFADGAGVASAPYPYNPAGGNVKAVKTGPYTLEVTFTPDGTNNEFFYVPMFVRATGNGEVKVRVSDRLTGFKNINDLRPIATIQSSMTNAFVDKVGNIARNNTIVETSTSQARLRLVESTNTSWDTGSKIELRLDNSDFTFYNELPLSDTKIGTKAKVGTVDALAAIKVIDGRTLEITPNLIPNRSSSYRDELILDLPIRVSRDAKVGTDVTASFRGDVNPSNITLAKYTDYAIELKADKVLDVIAGQDVPGRYVSTVTFEEMVPGSLLDGRVIEVSLVGVDKDGKEKEEVAAFQYNEQIKLSKVKGTGDLNIVATDLRYATPTLDKTVIVDKRKGNLVDGKPSGDYILHDLMEIEVNRGSNSQVNTTVANADKWELKVPFVVATDYTGDLMLKFHGAGVDKQTVKIATVKAPVTFEIGKESGKLADLNIGQQHQVAPEVTIKETVAGALLERDVVKGFENKYGLIAPTKKNNISQWGTIFTSGKVEVKEGNSAIKDVNTNANVRDFWLKDRSTTAATFLLSDIKVTLDRTVPYGEFKISVDAGNVYDRHDLTDKIDTVAYFNVVTPHPEDKNVLTVFTIGEASYKQTISGVEKNVELDVAPQIMNNRTMMPIRYVADALGAKVNYDTATRTAIFSKDAITVSMTLDTNIMFVNGSPVVMETAPVVQADRALVSLVNIAQAFGLNSVSAPATGDIVWDAAAKTVTLFPSAQ